MTKENLLSDLEQTTQKLTETLCRFTADNFHERPSEQAWSAAHIAAHLVKVYFSTFKALSGETIPTNRPPEQKITLIKQAMEDNTTKRVAPERVRPSEEGGERAILIQQLRNGEERLKEVVNKGDITDACVSFQHPALGTMTKMEWMAFNNYHTKRHIKQLERLLQKVSA
jgi:hypothetical protein